MIYINKYMLTVNQLTSHAMFIFLSLQLSALQIHTEDIIYTVYMSKTSRQESERKILRMSPNFSLTVYMYSDQII